MATTDVTPVGSPRRVPLGWAFIERQINLWKRYWAWELVWLVYGVVNTLAITFIATEAGRTGEIGAAGVEELTLFLLVGTLMWAYLAAVLDDMSLVIMWERWEGTIEHTLMTPVSRVVHLVSMAIFGVCHAIVRTLLILVCALPFLSVSFAHASWSGAAAVVAVGSVSLIGLGIFTGILPLLYPERGEQMSFMVQAVLLLLSGVYYSISVLPAWLQPLARALPTTYMLRGVRAALIDGRGLGHQGGNLLVLAGFGVVLIPASVLAFGVAERWAKKTGRLKRQG
ncbi:MAG TPA: ABC transporter permease [Acidimicrobiia bacterium]|nr:ABC transporter permease [Acidimicrobiia bacterium]